MILFPWQTSKRRTEVSLRFLDRERNNTLMRHLARRKYASKASATIISSVDFSDISKKKLCAVEQPACFKVSAKIFIFPCSGVIARKSQIFALGVYVVRTQKNQNPSASIVEEVWIRPSRVSGGGSDHRRADGGRYAHRSLLPLPSSRGSRAGHHQPVSCSRSIAAAAG